MGERLSIQFDVEDQDRQDELYELANKLGRKRKNRKIRAAGVVKELLFKILDAGLAEKLLEFHADERGTAMSTAEDAGEYDASPKRRTDRQGKKQAGS